MRHRTILHLTGMASTKIGSLEGYILETVRHARRRGVASVVQFERWPNSERYAQELTDAGALIVAVPIRSQRPADIIVACRLVWKYRPTHIITHFLPRRTLLAVAITGRVRYHARVVTFVHSLEGLDATSHAKLAYERCDVIVTVSEAGRQDLLRGGVDPRKIRTNYLGLPIDTGWSDASAAHANRSHLGIGPDMLVVGCIAFDDPVKGVDDLIRAMSRVVAVEPEAVLLQIGVDGSTSVLVDLAGKVGVGDHVKFAGIVDEGWRLLDGVDVYVQPSVSEGGVPLAVMEAMRMGLPLVATDVGGNTEAVTPQVTGLLVPVGDPGAMAAAITRLLQSPAERQLLGTNARAAFLERFDLEASVRKLLDDVVRI